MSDTGFSKQGTTLTVTPRDRLDTVTSPVVEEEVLQHLDGVKLVIMDFSQLEYMSSGGLRMLLTLEQQMEDRGGHIEVIHANNYILEVFEMVGFFEVVKVIRDK